MSCHDIGRGLNSVTKEIIKAYDAGEMSTETARKLIVATRKGVHWCDGNEDEAVACIIDSRCGCCLKKIQPGKPLYNLYDATFSFSEIDEMEQNEAIPFINDRMCTECFDRIVNNYRKDENAGKEERKYIEEKIADEDWQAHEEDLERNYY